MFEQLTNRLQDVFDGLGRVGKLTEKDVDKVMREVRMALLEADVALPVVKDFVGRVKERAIGADVAKSLKPGQQVVKIVHEELLTTLGEGAKLNFSGSTKPHVIMLVGLQGSGKTTTGAKLALFLRREGRSPFMIAADTYRPAAVDQLVTLAKQIQVPYYEEGTTAKPPDIVARGLKVAKEQNAAVVIVDTAGRLQIDETLMTELEEIKRRTQPAEILLVADSMTGQEAVHIAEGFNGRLGITGLILTKIDGDARGGAALSMRAVTGVPIKFLGTSEKVDGFEAFSPDRLAQRILGMGDVMGLIEKAEAEFDEAEAIKLQKKLMENQFTLQDFLEQLQKIKRMGSITSLLGMIPGMNRFRDQIDEQQVDKRIRRVEAIINSMTKAERENPKVLNASRRKRIAAGSGVEVRDVNEVLKQFKDMQSMMSQVRKGKFPGMPGGGLPPGFPR
ncbi:MAG: signal recognition particle protein [Anaerolineae bacterium]|uniref:signal recognition particle protein n=1 Tax=Candidatus Flexifilum breve TaxID=3140694 RepID=UPI001AC6D55B|nr:signal recognition particle protein [Chloroflexota bacterium]MBN8638435.1 signal recognition particle protein [Anaerolineae bacterium]